MLLFKKKLTYVPKSLLTAIETSSILASLPKPSFSQQQGVQVRKSKDFNFCEVRDINSYYSIFSYLLKKFVYLINNEDFSILNLNIEINF